MTVPKTIQYTFDGWTPTRPIFSFVHILWNPELCLKGFSKWEHPIGVFPVPIRKSKFLHETRKSFFRLRRDSLRGERERLPRQPVQERRHLPRLHQRLRVRMQARVHRQGLLHRDQRMQVLSLHEQRILHRPTGKAAFFDFSYFNSDWHSSSV